MTGGGEGARRGEYPRRDQKLGFTECEDKCGGREDYAHDCEREKGCGWFRARVRHSAGDYAASDTAGALSSAQVSLARVEAPSL